MNNPLGRKIVSILTPTLCLALLAACLAHTQEQDITRAFFEAIEKGNYEGAVQFCSEAEVVSQKRTETVQKVIQFKPIYPDAPFIPVNWEPLISGFVAKPILVRRIPQWEARENWGKGSDCCEWFALRHNLAIGFMKVNGQLKIRYSCLINKQIPEV